MWRSPALFHGWKHGRGRTDEPGMIEVEAGNPTEASGDTKAGGLQGTGLDGSGGEEGYLSESS